ncbi:hypothetical protein BDZ45DRAFT_748234 [Acephala macrosclerotiorum]|nr:hypothetical protein BDZ45DRAFT_748234 [Acephala macrosclerotiorum]
MPATIPIPRIRTRQRTIPAGFLGHNITKTRSIPLPLEQTSSRPPAERLSPLPSPSTSFRSRMPTSRSTSPYPSPFVPQVPQIPSSHPAKERPGAAATAINPPRNSNNNTLAYISTVPEFNHHEAQCESHNST